MSSPNDTPVLDLLASMTADSVVASSLDPQSLMVARIAAFAIGFICVVVATSVSLAGPWVLKYAVDDLRQGVDAAKLRFYAGAMLGLEGFPDLGALSDRELKDLIQQLTEEEQEVSYRRRILHGKIDILRAELVNRLRIKHAAGESAISGADVQQLTDILAGKGIPEADQR